MKILLEAYRDFHLTPSKPFPWLIRNDDEMFQFERFQYLDANIVLRDRNDDGNITHAVYVSDSGNELWLENIRHPFQKDVPRGTKFRETAAHMKLRGGPLTRRTYKVVDYTHQGQTPLFVVQPPSRVWTDADTDRKLSCHLLLNPLYFKRLV